MKVTGEPDGNDEASLPYGLDFTFGSPIENETNSFESRISRRHHDFRIDKGKKKNGISVWHVGEIAREGTSTIGKLNETQKRLTWPTVSTYHSNRSRHWVIW
jgi:hypothetical protein